MDRHRLPEKDLLSMPLIADVILCGMKGRIFGGHPFPLVLRRSPLAGAGIFLWSGWQRVSRLAWIEN